MVLLLAGAKAKVQKLPLSQVGEMEYEITSVRKGILFDRCFMRLWHSRAREFAGV